MKRLLLIIFFLTTNGFSFAQCAMCRATLETNVSNGEQAGLASSLNFGILYLFAAPYTIILVVGYLWYRASSKNKKLNELNLQ